MQGRSVECARPRHGPLCTSTHQAAGAFLVLRIVYSLSGSARLRVLCGVSRSRCKLPHHHIVASSALATSVFLPITQVSLCWTLETTGYSPQRVGSLTSVTLPTTRRGGRRIAALHRCLGLVRRPAGFVVTDYMHCETSKWVSNCFTTMALATCVHTHTHDCV